MAAVPEAPSLRLDLPLEAPAHTVMTMALPVSSLPVASAGVVELAQVDVSPRRLSTPLPVYPAWARSRRIEGSVTLRYTVDEDGRVRDVQVEEVTGDERFAAVAREAVAVWRYEPGQIGGRKVRVALLQTVRFQLVDR
jgi:protein TonB